MGCPYNIENQIIKKQGQYIFALKGNQGTLHDDVIEYFADASIDQNLYHCEDWDKGHGRIESRVCWVDTNLDWLHERHPHGRTIHSMIRIDSIRDMKGKVSKENRYDLSSSAESTINILKKIRIH